MKDVDVADFRHKDFAYVYKPWHILLQAGQLVRSCIEKLQRCKAKYTVRGCALPGHPTWQVPTRLSLTYTIVVVVYYNEETQL